MSPQEHYEVAEQLLEQSTESFAGVAEWKVAMAQVHATLALVGATLATSNTHLDPDWFQVGAAPTWQKKED